MAVQIRYLRICAFGGKKDGHPTVPNSNGSENYLFLLCEKWNTSEILCQFQKFVRYGRHVVALASSSVRALFPI